MDHSEKIVNLLAKSEENLGELYKIYAQKFPEHAALWNHLSGEEFNHGKAIRDLYAKSLDSKNVYFDKNRFEIEAVQTFHDYITKLIFKAKQVDLNLKDVLFLSLDIEKALIESRVYQVFDADQPELKKTLTYLKEETQEHIKEIQETIDKTK